MTIKVLLDEAPVIEVQKKGVTYKIPEIPAYDVARVHQFLVGMVPDEIDQVFKILFGKEADKARKVFTVSDIRKISMAIGERERGPLASESDGMDQET